VEEATKHGDILQARVPDDYKSLPLKVLSVYQWIHDEWGNRSDFYTFTDYDCVLNLTRIYDFLTSNKEQSINDKKIYCGYQLDAVCVPAGYDFSVLFFHLIKPSTIHRNIDT